MIGFYDYTVILTYLSLMSGTIGIMLCLNGMGHPYLGMFFLLFSGLCDTFDGKVARSKKDRTTQMKKFGIQIDSLSDLIAFGMLPACIGIAMLRYTMCIPDLSGVTRYLLTHYTLQTQIVLSLIAVLYVLAAMIRLAYFNVMEEEDRNRDETGDLHMTILEFLYNTVPGRFLLKPLTGPRLSRICGHFLDSELSSFLIQPFVKQNAIQLSDYETTDIKSFNDFFSRKIKQGKRPIDMEENHLIAPCDGLLSVWKIKENTVFPVKQSHYTISSLLHSKKLAQRYHGGYCLVYRLCVNHYHRYCYVDSGQKSRNFFIPGRLHTVRPVALREVPVFTENSREYTLIRTEKFGTVVQMEVGAMLVGRIVNHEEKGSTIRGKEKGYFQYGGSTIIVLIEPEQVQIREDILQSSALAKEVPVKMGEVIGHALEHKRTIQ